MAGVWHFPKNKTDCSLDINRHRFTMRKRATSAFWFVAYASHTLYVYRNACLGRIYASHGMTKLCIRKNRSIFLQKYVIRANAETLAYDFIIYAFWNLSLNCQFNTVFLASIAFGYTQRHALGIPNPIIEHVVQNASD